MRFENVMNVSLKLMRLVVLSSVVGTWSVSLAASPRDYPEFNWDTVPVAFHFGKNGSAMTAAEAQIVASRSNLICLEKGHAGEQFEFTEDGIEQEARRLKQFNPNMKVIFYWNAFLDYPMFRAHQEYQRHPEWWLRTLDGKLDKKHGSLMRYDLSNADVRAWWTDVAHKAVVAGSCDGVFMDAFPQIVADANRKRWGDEKYEAIQQGLVSTIKETRAKIGADKLIFYNGIRSTSRGQIGSEFTQDTDAAMIEHFGHFQSSSKESMLNDIEAMMKAGKQGKIVVFKAWPGFSWVDKTAMKKPLEVKRRLAAENITFPLAAFLVGAQEHSYFIYSWGYRMRLGCLEWYPEFDKPLGEPLGELAKNGWTLGREFKHASVSVNLETKKADINWQK
jgi:hypothetical protein